MSDSELRARIEDAIERDDPIELADVASRVGLEAGPHDWAQSCCIQLARHRNEHVRGNAVAALGHLARRFGRLDPQRIPRLVQNALFDRSEVVRSGARSAADDLRTFLGWQFEEPPPGGGA